MHAVPSGVRKPKRSRAPKVITRYLKCKSARHLGSLAFWTIPFFPRPAILGHARWGFFMLPSGSSFFRCFARPFLTGLSQNLYRMDLSLKSTRSLFSKGEGDSPLPYRMRPSSLDEVVGQEHLVGPSGVLRSFLSGGNWPSMILYGPPGTGKTGFVKLLPGLLSSDYSFATLNATTSGVADLKKELERGAERRYSGGRHVVVVDEIHTWSKSQQEVLLDAVESGQIILLGLSNATPYGALIPPLASRVLLFPFYSLEDDALLLLLGRGCEKLGKEQGFVVTLTKGAEGVLVRFAGGDGRRLLATLEGAALQSVGRSKETEKGGVLFVHEDDVLRVLQSAGQYYGDKDTHYDIISAFIKSVRNYEVDAALHWLARMIEGGEDPLYIARRLVILASEDVGLADPHALTQAVSCYTAVSQIGLPEGRIPLSLTTITLCLSPKSVSAYRAIDRAISDVRHGFTPPVPVHLRDRTSKRGLSLTSPDDLEYLYPPDQPDGVSPQNYLPEGSGGHRYYIPEDRGREREMKERYEAVVRIKNNRTKQD